MNSTIWKFELGYRRGVHIVTMPKGAELLSVHVQHGTPCLWALVDPSQTTEDRHIAVELTGGRHAPGRYLGTVLLEDETHVAHYFEHRADAEEEGDR